MSDPSTSKPLSSRSLKFPLPERVSLRYFAAVTRIARQDRGAPVFLDGFQDCGTRPIDVKALDVDFYVTGTLKYLLGPPGVAFLYVKRSAMESLKLHYCYQLDSAAATS